MTMIYLAPICSTTSTIIRRWGPSLLAVPLCVLLIGCDSASSNSDQDMRTKASFVDASAESDPQSTSEDIESDSMSESNPDDSLNESTEGQSLIAAAQSSNEGHMHPSTIHSESNSSALQATLMGDYGGMVPCDDCDSIDVTLNLFSDGSVLKSSTYHDAEQQRAPLLESGVYRQDKDKITIVYEDKHIESYYIQDNHLILIDEQKNLNNDYTLSRK
ncbi:copper resistance protein NlpE N-terminal domain-containing protein [Psychrobacter piscatorii]|uniref:copper resistance protein NlpE N-terminal domain-containing protein n=2 Tax=Psychrobacter piscatorii TaxID=554343 RepID=UPI0031E0C027